MNKVQVPITITNIDRISLITKDRVLSHIYYYIENNILKKYNSLANTTTECSKISGCDFILGFNGTDIYAINNDVGLLYSSDGGNLFTTFVNNATKISQKFTISNVDYYIVHSKDERTKILVQSINNKLYVLNKININVGLYDKIGEITPFEYKGKIYMRCSLALYNPSRIDKYEVKYQTYETPNMGIECKLITDSTRLGELFHKFVDLNTNEPKYLTSNGGSVGIYQLLNPTKMPKKIKNSAHFNGITIDCKYVHLTNCIILSKNVSSKKQIVTFNITDTKRFKIIFPTYSKVFYNNSDLFVIDKTTVYYVTEWWI